MTAEQPLTTTHELFADNPVALEVWQRQQLLLPGGERHAAFREAVLETPLFRLPSELLPADLRNTSAEVWIKDDRRQHDKAYKLRGAFNKLYDEREKRGGNVSQVYAIAASTGNHMVAVQRAAEALGYAGAAGYYPKGASLAKLFGAIRKGVQLTEKDTIEAAIEAANTMGKDRFSVFVPPFDDLSIMAGQGTVMIEIVNQLDGEFDESFFAAAGCGLAAGNRVAQAELMPHAGFTFVQAQGSHGAVLAQRGEKLEQEDFRNKCDGAAVLTPGELPMAVLVDSRYTNGVVVEDKDIGEAMVVLAATGEVPEPAGALALAGLLASLRANPSKAGRLVAHVSGANKTPEKVAEYLEDALTAGLITPADRARVNSQAYLERVVDGVDEIDEIGLRRIGKHAGSLIGGRVLSSPAALDNRRRKSQ